MKVRVSKVDPSSNIKLPSYQTAGASGFDLVSAEDRSWTIGPGQRCTIRTGLRFEIPEGYEMQVRPRSGLAFNHGVLTSFGTIDSDYRGEVKLNMMNHGRVDITIAPGDRIAQGVIAPVIRAEFELVDELSKTERGKKGLGSTGNR
jgi:dUTP pyrophosphatase